ncbi:hypothetical protein C3B61_17220 [Cryobacterium zongtaii]|uniref:Uncharacterized protein n=1 Tax=Cryobacterium zongtaii TaxID=1259217 RepID=A0A2S3ZAU3_9MICO|nr:hypothetical protein [Cryobacterium zongtaii]POH62582.1 hypothetical protein C3B61_17220 [Cryobacterium zongtaii]
MHMTIHYDPAMVNPGICYVGLGYLTPFESGHTLTVGDRNGGDKRGVKLTPAYYTFISSLDPTVGEREFTAEELGLLGWLAGQGFIALVTGDAGPENLKVVPVPRRDIAVVEDLDEGYLLRAGDDAPFAVSELGARFLPFVDGERTLGEIAQAVKTEVLAGHEGRLSVEKNEKDQGRTFDSVLVEEALVLIRDFARAGAITFEPTA